MDGGSGAAPEPRDDRDGVRRSDADGTVIPLSPDRRFRPPARSGEPPLREVIGEVLREERHTQRRTLAEVAADAAVSLPYLSEVERGTKEVSSDVLTAICDALDLTLVQVLERSAGRLGGRVGGSGAQMLAA